MRKILPYIILLSALTVSGSAAFYSVYGLSKLFAGAAFQVIIMTSALEISKLVIATLLHEYWDQLNRILKTYLTIATLILIIITSAGIYGFLSNAYQLTSNQDKIVTRGIELIDTKQSVYEKSLNEFISEKETITESISELRKAISTPGQTQTIDRRTGQLITSTTNNSAVRRTLEKQLDAAVATRDELTLKIQIANDSINQYEIEKIELMNSSDAAAELGPLKYISNLTDVPMDNVVNYFILLIIFVFDPLAISLVIAANFAFKQSSKLKYSTDTDPYVDTYKETIQTSTPTFKTPAAEDTNIVNSSGDKLLESRMQRLRENIQFHRPKRDKKTQVPEETTIPLKDEDSHEITKDPLTKIDLSPTQIKNMSHEKLLNYVKKHMK